MSKSYNLMMLKWPALDDGKIPAGAGIIGLVTEYDSKSFMIPVLQAYEIPLFGTQYKLTETPAIEDALEQGIESLIGINENLGYLTDRGTLSLYGGPSAPASLGNFSNLASRSYSIKEISFKQGIPEGLSSLLIVRPTEQFSDYDLYQIDQALMRGTNLAFFLDSFMEPAPAGSPYQQQGQLVPVNTGLEKLMDHYGVKVNQSLVLDENCFKQRLPEQYGGGEQTIYFAPIIEAGQINSQLDFMKNIKQFIAYKISPLTLNDQQIKNNKLKTLKLFSSSEKSWEMKGQIMLNPMFIKPPAGGEGMASRPLAYIIEGSFPSYFAHKPIPGKPADDATSPAANPENNKGNDAPKEPTTNQLEQKGGFLSASKPAKIFIIGSSEMLSDNLISEQADNTNTTLIMNIIDVLNNREDIALMRSKVQTFNPLDVRDEKVKVAAKFFNIAGLPVIVVFFGMLVLLRRHNRKKRIEAAF